MSTPKVMTVHLKDSDQYIRAASGIQFISKDQFYVIQDSKRSIGFVGKEGNSYKISKMIRTDLDNISHDDDSLDYESQRKAVKADYEAITPLPDGSFLVLGSGSDLHKTGPDTKRTHSVQLRGSSVMKEQNIYPMYAALNKRLELLVNIEGAFVIPWEGKFKMVVLDRGNLHSKGSILVFYDHSAWMNAWTKNTAEDWEKLEIEKVINLTFPTNVLGSDLLFGFDHDQTPTFLIPVSKEEDDAKNLRDGIVTYTGIAKINLTTSAVQIFQTETTSGKIEGLSAFNSKARGYERNFWRPGVALYGVVDLDNEVKASPLVEIRDIS